ncbi:MAG TPA: TIGR04540 family protein [Thermoanaerobacterales bacterium]|nr:TIGR04540 family protein [Thermoanaerobacterales bacterium]
MIKTFYKNQTEVAEAINFVIDSYWADKIVEEEMIQTIKDIIRNNDSLLHKNGDYTTIIKQRSGKRRLEIVSRIKEDL